MASTSRPISSASRAVMSDPDCTAASTTKVPCVNAATRRLRFGKLEGNGPVPSRNSLSTKPCSAMRRHKGPCPFG